MDQIVLRITKLHEAAAVPAYAHPGDAGLDLTSVETVTIGPGERVAVGTGLTVAIPDGYVGLVHPRSGLAVEHGLTVINAPGTVDSGYRGELKVLLVNLGTEPVAVGAGDRVAQLVVQQVARAEVVEVDELPTTPRGHGGFGSTGVSSEG